LILLEPYYIQYFLGFLPQDVASQDVTEASAAKKPKLEAQQTAASNTEAVTAVKTHISFEFTPAFLLLSESWSTLAEHGSKGQPKEFQLDNFAFDKKQTLAFKVSILCLSVKS
jgi:hypothetical protein